MTKRHKKTRTEDCGVETLLRRERRLLLEIRLLIALIGMLGLAVALTACTREPVERDLQEYVLQVEDGFVCASPQSKATAVTAVPSSLYWCATSGTSGSSETEKYAPETGDVFSGRISTGRYQTASPSSYNWYLSNVPMGIGGTGATLTVTSTDVDCVAGCTAASSSASPSVALRHIFARTGALTFNTQSGYAVSGVSWTISRSVSGTAGTYNIAKDQWSASPSAMGPTPLSGSSDMYLLPGEYTVAVTYTLTKEHYAETFTRKGSVTLLQGMVNDITATATGGAATSIVVSPSLSGWTDGPGIQLVM